MRSITSFSRAITNRTSFESVNSISSDILGSMMSKVASVTDVSSAATGKTLYMRAVEAGIASVTSVSIVIEPRSIASVSWYAAITPRRSSSESIPWSRTACRMDLPSVFAVSASS